MAKHVFFRLSPVALVVLGWLSFVVGQLFELTPLHRLILLGAARVLPQALEQGAPTINFGELSIRLSAISLAGCHRFRAWGHPFSPDREPLDLAR